MLGVIETINFWFVAPTTSLFETEESVERADAVREPAVNPVTEMPPLVSRAVSSAAYRVIVTILLIGSYISVKIKVFFDLVVWLSGRGRHSFGRSRSRRGTSRRLFFIPHIAIIGRRRSLSLGCCRWWWFIEVFLSVFFLLDRFPVLTDRVHLSLIC